MSRRTLVIMRLFMVGMLAATASRVPTVTAFAAWLIAHPAVQQIRGLQGMLGPLLGMLAM